MNVGNFRVVLKENSASWTHCLAVGDRQVCKCCGPWKEWGWGAMGTEPRWEPGLWVPMPFPPKSHEQEKSTSCPKTKDEVNVRPGVDWDKYKSQSHVYPVKEVAVYFLITSTFSKCAAVTWPLLISKNDPLPQLSQCKYLTSSFLKKKRNIFGILRSKQRQLWCGHSWGKCNRCLDFLLLWWVVLNFQRRYFLIHTWKTMSFPWGRTGTWHSVLPC